jgi:hypothetical protein
VIAKAGEINRSDRELPYDGGRSVEGGTPFAFQLDRDGKPAQPYAAWKKVDGGGRIIVLAEGMASLFLGSAHGKRLTAVDDNTGMDLYWGKDSAIFMEEVLSWLARLAARPLAMNATEEPKSVIHSVPSAGVSGEWSGTLKPEGQEARRVFVILKQEADSLTGTTGPDKNEQWPISDGKVDGNKMTGTVAAPDGLVYKLRLTVGGDRIKGELDANSDGRVLKGALDVTRVKP